MKTTLSVVAALALSATLAAAFQVYNFSGSQIQFNGSASSFQFNPSAGFQWSITSQDTGTGAVGLLGSFTGGPWTYGAVTSSGLAYSATVNPSQVAGLSIADGLGGFATANLDWVEVGTFQSLGSVNGNLSINLSNLSYSGPNADLTQFFSAPAGKLVISFQFNPLKTLSQLSAGSGPYITTFSGSMTAVPEPASGLLIGLGSLLFALFRRFSL